MKRRLDFEKMRKIDERCDLKAATPFGGSNIFLDFAKEFGLFQAMKRELDAHEKGKNAVYSLAATTSLLVVGRVLGIERVSGFDQLEKDPLFLRKFAVERFPDFTTLYKDLLRFDAEGVEALQRVNLAMGKKLLGDDIILDLDSTVETVYGNQQGAAVGYNPTKPGRKSFHPLVAFDGASKVALRGQLRSGNAAPNTDVLTFLDDVIASLPEGKRVVRLRGDRGFQGETFFAHVERREIEYAVKLRSTSSLVTWADHLTYRVIGEVAGDILEVAAGSYMAAGWPHPRRVVVVRKRLQGKLFDAAYDHTAIATNTDWDPEDVYHFYNHRCTMETLIREAKEGFALDAFSSQTFLANAADLLLKLTAYNVLLAYDQLLGPAGPRRTAAYLRRRLLFIPAFLVRHARQQAIRLPQTFGPIQQFFRCRLMATTFT